MIPLIICALLASASALNLPPALVSNTFVRNYLYSMSDEDTSKDLLQKMSKIPVEFSFNDHNYMNQIAGEIFMYAEFLDANPYHSLSWQLKITKSLGVLRVIDISAKAKAVGHGRILLIVAKAFEIHQHIPQVFGQKENCVKNGRKYGITGEWKYKCSMVDVPRELTSDEINQVSQALIKKIPAALREVGQN